MNSSVNQGQGNALIDVRNLVKTYKTPAGYFTAVKGLDVQVQTGEFVAIIGKSGSGKSTFINMLTGIDRPTSGEIYIGGAPIHAYDETQMAVWRGRNLGIVFQFFQLLPTLTLLENVILPMELNHLYSKRERRERALSLLERVEMASQAHKLPAAVSGGQQQRVAIARALANDPPLLVADEPTGNLDSKTAEKIFNLFEDLVASGKTILMVTHDSDLARRVNRTIVISDGEIVNEYLVRALASLTQDQLVEVARRVQPQSFPPGAPIVRQGEAGDKFYIIVDGKADVFINQPGGTQILVNRLKAGQYFGEMALLGGGVRAATVSAGESGVSVVGLDNATFTELINDSRGLRDELTGLIERHKLVNRLQIMSSLNHDELSSIAQGTKAVTFSAGQEIIRQGDTGDTFYLIVEGRVDVLARNERGDEVRVNQLGEGQYFGEMALMGDHRRNATIRVSAETPAKLIELSEQDFESLTAQSDVFRKHVTQTADVRDADLRRAKQGQR